MRSLYSLLLMFAVLLPCPGKANPATAALTPVNVCYSALTGTQATVWYAQEKGLFRKHGLQVKLVSVIGGAKAATTLITGDMDICEIAATSVINAAAARKDVVIVAGLINTVSGSLMADPKITSLAMLKGKIIGTQDGSNTDAVIRLLLRNYHLVPDRDVVLLNIGGDPERAAALKARKVDATFIIPPLTIEMRSGGYVELANAGAAKIPFQATSIATTRRFMAEHRSTVHNFMKAIMEAIVRIKRDPVGSKAVLARYLSLDPIADAAALQETYDSILLGTLEDVPYPTLKGLQNVIDVVAKENPGAALVKPHEVVDTSILDELKKSGFISRLKNAGHD